MFTSVVTGVQDEMEEELLVICYECYAIFCYNNLCVQVIQKMKEDHEKEVQTLEASKAL